jgi:putative peptide zinc metalloprotease protein
MRLVPELGDGVELIGEYQGSGYQEPPYLARRADGQVILLTRLLYLVATRLDGRCTHEQLAKELSAEWGRSITAEHVSFLIENRLRPAGMVAADSRSDQSDQSGVMSRRNADRLLALRFRVALVPEHVVAIIAKVFQPLYWPPVVIVVLTGLISGDVWMITHGGLAQIVPSARALINQPEQTLLALGLLIIAAIFHECGHVAACRYGGAKPGVMGVGIYLVWPAMYSTVTDAYRLGRGGRLRTDLGGVYFNALALTIMIAIYARTGLPWLLVAVVAWHGATAWQFLPSIRLDGYYILSDLVGVPDLFDRMMPTLRSMLPGRQLHPRVRELKPWARRVIALWVVLVIPCLAYWLIGFLVLAPYVLPTVWESLIHLCADVGDAAHAGNVATVAVGVIQIVLLFLPWAGMTIILIGLICRLVRRVRAFLASRSASHTPAD